MSDANTREADLLIIRRGGAAEAEAHKGGVWKIAYADFMTAMMAFFLVMWLINATSETTKTGVANYFNPIKLADGMQLPRKGLHDPEDEEFKVAEGTEDEAAELAHIETDAHAAEPNAAEMAAAETAAAETDAAGQASGEGTVGADADGGDGAGQQQVPGRLARFSEDALFRDPYAVLAAIAAEAEGTTSMVSRSGTGDIGGSGNDRIGSETYGDPFDPGAWFVDTRPVLAERDLPAETAPAEAATQAAAEAGPQPSPRGLVAELDTAGEALPAEPEPAPALAPAAGENEAAGQGDGASADADPEAPSLRGKLAAALGAVPGRSPRVTVERADGGVLISLADQVDFGMFAIGSAEPLPETIAVMEKIATALNDLPGKVIIRGHTDARPFRSGGSDNWRLSSARAHMAYHMLVRGGLDEVRVERIEGYADRQLKLPDDPEAAENRRIDILVQEVHS